MGTIKVKFIWAVAGKYDLYATGEEHHIETEQAKRWIENGTCEAVIEDAETVELREEFKTMKSISDKQKKEIAKLKKQLAKK